MKDYYFILGIARTADNHQIKEAFRKLCLKYHPDRTVTNYHNHERYMEICEAYRVLSNKEKKRRYDNATTNPATEPVGILDEIQTSYRGQYPWLAAFAVVIAAGIAMLFLSRKEKGVYGIHNTIISEKTALTQPTHKREPKSIIIVDTIQQKDTVTVVEVPVVKKDTVIPKTVVADTLNKTQTFIAGALDKHTVEPNRKKHPTSERNFQYSFRGEKLFVTYEQPDAKGKIIRKQVAIPVKKIESVYVYAGQLWITSPQKAIQVMNLKNGKQEKSDFFSVRFDAEDPKVEQEIVQAFAKLKTDN
jgi:hypothetical protein